MAKLLLDTFVILFLLLTLRHSKFFKAHLVMNFLLRTVMIILLILFYSDLKCISPFNDAPSVQAYEVTMKPPFPFCPNPFTHSINPLFNLKMFSKTNFSVLSFSNAKLFPNFKFHDGKQKTMKLKYLFFLANFAVINKIITPHITTNSFTLEIVFLKKYPYNSGLNPY